MSELRLTPAQRRQLQATLKAPPSAGLLRRVAALLAVDRGQSVAAVAAWLGVSRQSVYNWLELFQQCPRPSALANRPGGGRPTRWTAEALALLAECLERRPDELGYAGHNWTVALLHDYLQEQTGLGLSDDTVRRQLQRLGYVWKRFRYVLPADPQREKKKRHPAALAVPAAAHC
jgi:transposase